jgi:hypothetical protein
MRRMGRFDQPAAVDAAVVPVARAVVRGFAAGDSRGLIAAARGVVPQTARFVAQHFAAGSPARQCTVTPAEDRDALAAASIAALGGCGTAQSDR